MTKYRGFRKDGKGWVEGYYGVLGLDTDIERHVIMVSTLNNSIGYDYFYFTDIEVHKDSIGMATTLTDKNGREIFGSIDGSKGGDVLMYIGTNMSSMDVIFQNGMFVGVGPFNTHSLHTYLTASDFQSIEIIGNQYEPQHVKRKGENKWIYVNTGQ